MSFFGKTSWESCYRKNKKSNNLISSLCPIVLYIPSFFSFKTTFNWLCRSFWLDYALLEVRIVAYLPLISSTVSTMLCCIDSKCLTKILCIELNDSVIIAADWRSANNRSERVRTESPVIEKVEVIEGQDSCSECHSIKISILGYLKDHLYT